MADRAVRTNADCERVMSELFAGWWVSTEGCLVMGGQIRQIVRNALWKEFSSCHSSVHVSSKDVFIYYRQNVSRAYPEVGIVSIFSIQ